MEIPTEIPTFWLVGGAIGAVAVVISFFGLIFSTYRSIIKKIDEGLQESREALTKLDTKMEDGFKESREALTTLHTTLDTKIDTVNTALRKEIRGVRQEIGVLTTVVFRLAEGVGVVRGIETARGPEEVPVPAEPIAEAG